ncbi:hypothetical protein [Stygiolobus caldivivus]|uniref:Uncharacterized protein n=1 Tax=Stygiolobus caldivivus TaxID=2824673 RepID=A0A8D5U5I4_9CREN|nr:hypothetical protein [Stygiolobus caldivivus]BCU69642.1 hypothetical protein KN1_09390 [Stygiolobus caldivivus]
MVDESKFYSNDPREVLDFYEQFENREGLISWMRERPTAEIKIKESETGDGEVVVVIPSINEEYQKRVLTVFEGLKVVFVISGGKFFNYARSVNAGVRYALENFSPSWIVVSNDDVYKVDQSKVLVDELSTLGGSDVELVYADRGKYHSYKMYLFKIAEYFPEMIVKFGKITRNPIITVQGEAYARFWKRFNTPYLAMMESQMGPLRGPLKKIIGEEVASFYNVGSFFIIPRWVAERGNVLDPIFINSHEDVWLSLSTRKKEFIRYRIREDFGGTLGWTPARFARVFCNEVYLSYLLDTHVEIIKGSN